METLSDLLPQGGNPLGLSRNVRPLTYSYLYYFDYPIIFCLIDRPVSFLYILFVSSSLGNGLMRGSKANFNFLHKPTCIGQISHKKYCKKLRRMPNFSHGPIQILYKILRHLPSLVPPRSANLIISFATIINCIYLKLTVLCK